MERIVGLCWKSFCGFAYNFLLLFFIFSCSIFLFSSLLCCDCSLSMFLCSHALCLLYYLRNHIIDENKVLKPCGNSSFHGNKWRCHCKHQTSRKGQWVNVERVFVDFFGIQKGQWVNVEEFVGFIFHIYQKEKLKTLLV